MSAASAFAVTFYLNGQKAGEGNVRGEGRAQRGQPHEFLREPSCVCVCGERKSNCSGVGGCHGLKSTSVATGATVHVARLTECGCVCVCAVSLSLSLSAPLPALPLCLCPGEINVL